MIVHVTHWAVIAGQVQEVPAGWVADKTGNRKLGVVQTEPGILHRFHHLRIENGQQTGFRSTDDPNPASAWQKG